MTPEIIQIVNSKYPKVGKYWTCRQEKERIDGLRGLLMQRLMNEQNTTEAAKVGGEVYDPGISGVDGAGS